MDIPNLATPPIVTKPNNPTFSTSILITIIVVSIVTGFWLSRLFPQTTSTISTTDGKNQAALSTDSISSSAELTVGKVYGNTEKTFKDSATGVLEKGSINGEGTHILNREGGVTQRASLTSSAVDLDLFVGKKVEIKGETNASTKTSWLLDVGSIKIIQ